MARHGIVNQAHFLETSDDIDGQRRKFAWYADAGVLGEQMIFGHFVHPTDEMVAAVNHCFDIAEQREDGEGAFLFRSETGNPVPKMPILFNKFNSALNGHGGAV